MAGPQDFMVSAPSLRVDTAPMLKVADILSNAPLNAARGFEAGTDIALKRALANPSDYTDANGNIDWGKLVKLGAQKGGLPFVEKLAPYVYMSGSNLPQTTSQTRQLLTGEQQPPLQQEAGEAHPAGVSHDNIVPRQSSPAGAAMPKITGTGSEFDPYVIPKDANSIKIFAQHQNFPNGSHFKIGDSGYGGVKGEINKDGNQKLVNLDTGKTMTAAMAAQMADAKSRLATGLREAASPQQPQPAPTGPATEPGAAAPPLPGRVPATASPQQPLPPLPDPALTNPNILANQRKIGLLRQQAVEEGRIPQVLGRKSGAEALEAQAKGLEDTNAKLAETLRKPLEKVNEARLQGFPTVQAKEAFDEAQKGDIDRGGKIYGAFNAAGSQYLQNKDVLDQADGILNDPTFFSGFGANANMTINSLITSLGGDPKAAMLQNAFQKVNATVLLNTLNRQRDEMAEAGNTSAGRQFASQIDIAREASPQLSTTVAGNRFLLTMNRRAGEQATSLAKMAQDYKIQNGHLDAKFDKQATEYLQKNPIITRQEKDHPELMGAPRVPSDILAANGGKGDKQAMIRWAQAMKLRPPEPGADRDPKKFQGDPIRLGDEPKYIHMPPITFPSLGEHRGP